MFYFIYSLNFWYVYDWLCGHVQIKKYITIKTQKQNPLKNKKKHTKMEISGLNFPPDHSASTASLSAHAHAQAHAHQTAHAAAAHNLSTGLSNASGGGLLTASMPMQNLVTLAALHNSQHHPHATQTHLTQTQHQQATAAQVHHAHMAQLMAAHNHQQQVAAAAQPLTAHLTAGTAAAATLCKYSTFFWIDEIFMFSFRVLELKLQAAHPLFHLLCVLYLFQLSSLVTFLAHVACWNLKLKTKTFTQY